MEKKIERLTVLLNNAITLLADETYDQFDNVEDWVEMVLDGLGTDRDELNDFGIELIETEDCEDEE